MLLLGGIPVVSAQNIYMMGDSHVGSKVYPNKVEEMIRSKYPDIKFTYWFKNGLFFSNFSSNPNYYSKISDFKTDILVLNMGTNEAYTEKFSPENFRKHLSSFYEGLIKRMPYIKVVFVTPFTNKLKVKGKFKVNENNSLASDEILSFVADHPDTYAIDINEEAGTSFIDTPGLIRDNVHLTLEGYRILGERVGEDLLDIPELWPRTQEDFATGEGAEDLLKIPALEEEFNKKETE